MQRIFMLKGKLGRRLVCRFFIICSVPLILLLQGCGPDTPTGAVVEFPDENLEEAVREELDLPRGPLTEPALLEMTSLTARERNIVLLDGLEYCTELEQLWLEANDIRDLAPLAGLRRLKMLGLSENNITDIAPLAGLDLEELFLDQNSITDIEPLSEMRNLRSLGLMGNEITDTAPLEQLPNLQDLQVD